LGNGKKKNSSEPVQINRFFAFKGVAALESSEKILDDLRIISVSCGYYFSAAITSFS
jgi:hypothetical protein